MPRTTASAVSEIFDTDLSTAQLDAWIAIATEHVDDIADADSSIDATRLEKIERLAAAHNAAAQDPRLAEYRVGDAQGTYQGSTGRYYDGTIYGQQARMLDPTGTLANVGLRKASITVPDAKHITSGNS